ncbi:MAG: N-acetylmuramoyl-L-alanine amidase [Clostridia bacterium]|nr:N-acetylmuramoyl-L-alanine amidase [Clostridia bacterium]
MKKCVVALLLAVFTGFCVAVSLCVNVLSSQTVFAGDNVFKIVVDAGHGGIDGGVSGVNTGVKESDLNLEIALKLCERLQSFGFETALTRKTKEGLYDTTAKGFKKRDMAKRKEIIEEESPALLLSVHQNYYPSSSQRGGQIFYLKGDDADEKLAACLQTRLNALYEKEGVKARKYMPAEYFILSCAPCPAALIECGFLSSPKDEKLLCSEAFLDRLVSSVCDGVTDYLFSQA